MIISHKHKFIFIKTKKTAGTSIEIALSSICGPDDIITPLHPGDEKLRRSLGYPGAQNYLLPWKEYTWHDWKRLLLKRRRKHIFHNHMQAHKIRSKIPEDMWNEYYKFCFERNPWDKITSYYYWTQASKGKENITLPEFLAEKKGELQNLSILYTHEKKVIVDKIYKYEKLDNALVDISTKLGLTTPLQMPEHRYKGHTRKGRTTQETLSQKEIETIKTWCNDVIEICDYSYQDKK